jgi:hypothetical protein
MMTKIRNVLYLALAATAILVAVGIELHQRLNGHTFNFTQLALRSIHHEHLITGSILIGIFFSVKFVGSR